MVLGSNVNAALSQIFFFLFWAHSNSRNVKSTKSFVQQCRGMFVIYYSFSSCGFKIFFESFSRAEINFKFYSNRTILSDIPSKYCLVNKSEFKSEKKKNKVTSLKFVRCQRDMNLRLVLFYDANWRCEKIMTQGKHKNKETFKEWHLKK